MENIERISMLKVGSTTRRWVRKTINLPRVPDTAMWKYSLNCKYNPKLRKMLIVEGRSYSDPILVNGKEDYNKSRRVEMRLKVKKFDITEVLFHGVQSLGQW